MQQNELEYWDEEGRRYVGHLVVPDHAKGSAVLLAHNAPGIDDFERGIAQRLVGLGYVVLCADYIGGGELLRNSTLLDFSDFYLSTPRF